MKKEKDTYKYYVFISYRHTDIKTARLLQFMLETYNFPVAIQKDNPELPKRMKVFRDKDELTSGDLNEEIEKKLDNSRYLVVICSPQSAASEYVGREIAYFRSTGKGKQIIPFIIKGTPHSDDECFHPELLKEGELLGIDVQKEEAAFRAIRFQKAFVRLVCKLMDLDFGVLWNRRKRFFAKLFSLAAAIMALIVALAFKLAAAQPFDATIRLEDKFARLPLASTHTDSIYLYLDNTDMRAEAVLKSDTDIVFRNIPGRFKDKEVRVGFRAYGFNTIDTCIRLGDCTTLPLSRNAATYGHIRYEIRDNLTDTAAKGITFDFGFMKADTDENGILDVTIPLVHQQVYYPVKIYAGSRQAGLTYPCNGGDYLTATDADELQVIYID